MGADEIVKGLRFAASNMSNRLQQIDAIDKAIAYLKDNLTFWKGVAASNAEWADKERVAREAAERRNSELEAVLRFYAAKESYRNRTVEEQRQLNGGVDPIIARSNVGRAPAGMALSDIQLDNHGDRARAALGQAREMEIK